MDFKQLQYFVTVAEEKSISAAAKKLFLAQPPLSRQIRLLEQEMGARLLERSVRGISLTPEGELLYKYATGLLETKLCLSREIRDVSQHHQDGLRVGIVPSASTAFLEKYLCSFHTAHPKVLLRLREGYNDIIELLEEGLIDFAVMRTPIPPCDAHMLTLHTEPMVAIGHRCYFEDIPEGSVVLQALSGKPMVCHGRIELMLYNANLPFEPDQALFCTHSNMCTSFLSAQAGFGIAIVPRSLLDSFRLDRLAWRELAEEALNTRVVLLWKQGVNLSPAAARFIAHAKKRTAQGA